MYQFKLAAAIFVLSSTLNFGCQASNMSQDDPSQKERAPALGEVELLQRGTNGPPQISVNTEAGTLNLTTVSTGCTRAEHFSIEVDSDGNYVGIRNKADRCRRRAFVVTYEYPLDNLPNAPTNN